MTPEERDAEILRLAQLSPPVMSGRVKDECLAVMRRERELSPDLVAAAAVVSEWERGR